MCALENVAQHPYDILLHFVGVCDCQTPLLLLFEDYKRALYDNLYIGANLMNLSKALFCLTHDLILFKLNGFCLSDNQCQLSHLNEIN